MQVTLGRFGARQATVVGMGKVPSSESDCGATPPFSLLRTSSLPQMCVFRQFLQLGFTVRG